ncbi:MAG: Fis family transcriptional regulator, partial [Zetaproteobacteria bacterium CG_4_9_14_3_um_filter_53_7]
MGRTPLILIVDEQENIRSILQKLVQAMGYKTLLAPDSNTALQLLEQQMPDLILLDSMLPNHSAMHLITTLRSKSTTTGIIIMADTGDLNEVAAFIKAGADDFLLKPFNATLFKSRIINALGSINYSYEINRLQAQLADCRLKEQQTHAYHSDFYRTLAHDLNNILAGILMRTELLLIN